LREATASACAPSQGGFREMKDLNSIFRSSAAKLCFRGPSSALAAASLRIGLYSLYSKRMSPWNESESIEPSRMAVQPCNRGTLRRLDEDAIVAIFPSGHHYADGERFLAGIDLASA